MNFSAHSTMRLQRSALLTALALVACGGVPSESSDGDGDDIDEIDQPIVGGINTTLRPEVGTLNKNGSFICTATLVDRRYVLTAGHCLDYSTFLNNYTVKFGSSSYNVSAIHLFGSYEAPVNSIPESPKFMDDVALLQLSTSVPANVASPAAIAYVPPDSLAPPYGTQTVFGYGCTSRAPETGAGTKRYQTFTFGNDTQLLCGGDSGGPAMYGGPTSNGLIWGVNTGFDAQDNDKFGGVTFYAEDILAVHRQWEGSAIEMGVARQGIDYSTTTKPSWSDCMTACQNDGKCRGFTYQGTSCALKSAISDWRFSNGATSYAGVQLAQEPFVARIGNDYSTFTTPVGDACLGACARDSNCKAYTYNLSTQSCKLKNGVPARTVEFASLSGVKRLLEANTDRAGTDYSHAAAANAAACESSCAGDIHCRSFTFVSGVCYKHHAATQPFARTGATSGVKRGLEMNTNRAGSDYSHFNTPFNWPGVCQAFCASDANCQSFTFAPVGRMGAGTPAQCWLKNAVPAASTFEGLVSGIKGLDFH